MPKETPTLAEAIAEVEPVLIAVENYIIAILQAGTGQQVDVPSQLFNHRRKAIEAIYNVKRLLEK